MDTIENYRILQLRVGEDLQQEVSSKLKKLEQENAELKIDLSA